MSFYLSVVTLTQSGCHVGSHCQHEREDYIAVISLTNSQTSRLNPNLNELQHDTPCRTVHKCLPFSLFERWSHLAVRAPAPNGLRQEAHLKYGNFNVSPCIGLSRYVSAQYRHLLTNSVGKHTFTSASRL